MTLFIVLRIVRGKNTEFLRFSRLLRCTSQPPRQWKQATPAPFFAQKSPADLPRLSACWLPGRPWSCVWGTPAKWSDHHCGWLLPRQDGRGGSQDQQRIDKTVESTTVESYLIICLSIYISPWVENHRKPFCVGHRLQMDREEHTFGLASFGLVGLWLSDHWHCQANVGCWWQHMEPELQRLWLDVTGSDGICIFNILGLALEKMMIDLLPDAEESRTYCHYWPHTV